MINKEILTLYLRTELKLDETFVNSEVSRMLEHPDIMNEFCEYLKQKSFCENPIQESGYTAQLLFESYRKHFKTVYSAYNYLIYLRTNPQIALKMIERGFPIK